VTNIEAFIFCYAGEYLSNKVSDNLIDLDEGFCDCHTKNMIKLRKLKYIYERSLHHFYQSKAIGLAVCNIAWYELEPEYNRMLLFILLRAQKQLTLTVGKMTDLSLRCFASVRFFIYYTKSKCVISAHIYVISKYILFR